LPADFNATPETPTIAACVARTPALGRVFSGAVLQVIDGQTICVAQGPTPAEWIQVKIAGAPRDAGRGALMAASFGQEVTCVVVKAVASGVEARCRIEGLALDQVMTIKAADREDPPWR
jgi:hypothetical protein